MKCNIRTLFEGMIFDSHYKQYTFAVYIEDNAECIKGNTVCTECNTLKLKAMQYA